MVSVGARRPTVAVRPHRSTACYTVVRSWPSAYNKPRPPPLEHLLPTRRAHPVRVGDTAGVMRDLAKNYTRIGIRTYSAPSSPPSRTMVGEPGSAKRNRASSLSS